MNTTAPETGLGLETEPVASAEERERISNAEAKYDDWLAKAHKDELDHARINFGADEAYEIAREMMFGFCAGKELPCRLRHDGACGCLNDLAAALRRLISEVARLKTELRSWEGAAHEYEEQARYAREAATAREATARAEEREACAEIADAEVASFEKASGVLKDQPDGAHKRQRASVYLSCWSIATGIAAAIRARSTP